MTLARIQNETDAQYIARLSAALAAKPASTGRVSFKASEKGALSLYGMGRFPVTLYKEQWRKVADLIPQIMDFITADEASAAPQLKTKEA